MTARFNTEAALYCPAASTLQSGLLPEDLTGRGTLLTLNNSAIWNPGTLCSDQTSLLFDNSQFHTAALDWVPTNTQHWTVSFWMSIENFNSVSTGTDDFLPLWYMPTGIASPNPGYDYFTGVGFEKDTNELVVRIADITHPRFSGGAFLAAPGSYDWHLVTVTCNNLNGVVTIYVDGVAVNSGAVAGVSYVAGTQSYIGGVQPSPGTGPSLTVANHFSGHIGEARFFDYPLTATEAAVLSANRDYSPLQTAISPVSPQQTRFLTGDTTTNETQWLEFTSGSTPTFNLGCNAALPASYTVADMQIAVDSLYPSIRRTPDLGYIGTTSQASTFNSVQDREYLLEYEPTSALPAEFTLISDFTGPIDVRLSYRNTDTQLLSSTYAPVARSHVFFTMVNAELTPQISATYSNSTTPASAVSVSCPSDNNRIVAFALRPSSETSSNATLLANYDSYGTIIPNGAVTSQRIDAYASTRHKNLGPNLVPGESLAESQKLKRDKTIELAAFQLLFTIFDELPREEISLVDAYQPNGLSACTSRIEFEPRELGPNAITSS